MSHLVHKSLRKHNIYALDVSLPRNEYHDVSPEPLGIIDPDHSSTSLERMDHLRSVSGPDTDMQHQEGCSDSDGDSNNSIIPISRCHQYMCAYGGGDDSTKAGNVYLCGKCPEL